VKEVFLFSLFCYASLLSLPIPSVWFSEEQLVARSKIYRQIKFTGVNDRKKFFLYELSYNPIRKWEELRIQGNLSNEGLLKAEKCALFGKKDMEKRWALLRGFDCEHLEWILILENNKLTLVEKNESLEKAEFPFVYKADSTILKTIEQNENYLLAWGMDAKRVFRAKQGKDIKSKFQLEILSVRESTIYFKTTPNPISYIEVEQPKKESFLEE
jgi:hypothetical protein